MAEVEAPPPPDAPPPRVGVILIGRDNAVEHAREMESIRDLLGLLSEDDDILRLVLAGVYNVGFFVTEDQVLNAVVFGYTAARSVITMERFRLSRW